MPLLAAWMEVAVWVFFFFNVSATSEIYPLSLHDALPISSALAVSRHGVTLAVEPAGWLVKLKPTVPCGAVLVPESVSATLTVQVAGLLAGVRSEERRVGEEGRSRWSPDH